METKKTVSKEEVLDNMKDVMVKTVYEFGKPVTYVTVRMNNGFTLRESTTCVDPKNYDEEFGKKICLEKIEDKVWFLLGYQLQQKVCDKAPENWHARLEKERDELKDKCHKLQYCLGQQNFKSKVSASQYDLLNQQLSHMKAYLDVLDKRLVE